MPPEACSFTINFAFLPKNIHLQKKIKLALYPFKPTKCLINFLKRVILTGMHIETTTLLKVHAGKLR